MIDLVNCLCVDYQLTGFIGNIIITCKCAVFGTAVVILVNYGKRSFRVISEIVLISGIVWITN